MSPQRSTRTHRISDDRIQSALLPPNLLHNPSRILVLPDKQLHDVNIRPFGPQRDQVGRLARGATARINDVGWVAGEPGDVA